MAHVLNGLEEQVALKTPLAKGVATLAQTFKTSPKLAIVLVGNHPPSLLYVEKKQAFARLWVSKPPLFICNPPPHKNA